MANVYRIIRYDHVTPAKRRRLLEEKLVPLLTESDESAPNIASSFTKGDWLIEYEDSTGPFYLYKFKEYQYKPRLHMYVKHYAQVDLMYRLESSFLTDDKHEEIYRTSHLEQLPPEVTDQLVRYENTIVYDPDEKIKQLIFLLEVNRNLLNKTGQEFLHQLDTGQITASQLKALLNKNFRKNDSVASTKITPKKKPVELVDPSKIDGAIQRAALEHFTKQHDGQLPTVTQFDELIKKFMNPSSGRRRRTRQY